MSRRFHREGRPPPRPIDAARLDELALAYVARYATSRAKLAHYLRRKLAERGFEGESEPPIEATVERMARLGYVDDQAFASARGGALTRRGYGLGRVSQALRAAGISGEAAEPATAAAEESAFDAALAFARRRRFGPYASAPLDPDQHRRAFAAMMRAGHSHSIARKILDTAPGDDPGEE